VRRDRAEVDDADVARGEPALRWAESTWVGSLRAPAGGVARLLRRLAALITAASDASRMLEWIPTPNLLSVGAGGLHVGGRAGLAAGREGVFVVILDSQLDAQLLSDAVNDGVNRAVPWPTESDADRRRGLGDDEGPFSPEETSLEISLMPASSGR